MCGGTSAANRAEGKDERSIPACAGEPLTKACSPPAPAVYPRVCGGTIVHAQGRPVWGGLSPRVRGNRCSAWPVKHWYRSIPACAGEPWQVRAYLHARTVYPRVCGGTDFGDAAGQAGVGLSPRVRGNPRPADDTHHQPRSIPACAGEPPNPEPNPVGAPVYPRVCGGTARIFNIAVPPAGLSPRVRGNRGSNPPAPTFIRSIPACAGEPPGVKIGLVVYQVYPRVCGGTGQPQHHRGRRAGLSPRVRGNQASDRERTRKLRSIPACAEEPGATSGGRYGQGVYPRVCGGTRMMRALPVLRQGLSPRVRGNPPRVCYVCRRAGSIPACAGEPCPRSARFSVKRVYPRVCGGTMPPLCADCRERGLSPRVRGNPVPGALGPPVRGSIPACAGEPRRRLPTGNESAVYPRVCGGTPSTLAHRQRIRGLSPRVRGNRLVVRRDFGVPRSIPACAGEP